MSKKAWYLLGILLTILVGTYFYWKLCCNTDYCGNKEPKKDREVNHLDEKVSAQTKLATHYPFKFEDGDFSVSSENNFNYNSSGFSFLKPLSEDVNQEIDKLQLYLGVNENKSVNITGLYTSGEENTSAFPTLGLARANDVKNYLMSKGIPSERINLFAEQNDDLVPEGTTYKGPILYGFGIDNDASLQKEKTELEALRTSLQSGPLLLHFETGQTHIDLTTAQRQKIADIARYLDKTENGKVIITGHTDNTGSRSGNISIGQKRADFVKNYLSNNGIPNHKIEATSKGEEQPIASNETEQGRAKNRRTILTVH